MTLWRVQLRGQIRGEVSTLREAYALVRDIESREGGMSLILSPDFSDTFPGLWVLTAKGHGVVGAAESKMAADRMRRTARRNLRTDIEVIPPQQPTSAGLTRGAGTRR